MVLTAYFIKITHRSYNKIVEIWYYAHMKRNNGWGIWEMMTKIIKELREQLNEHFQPFLNPPATAEEIQHAEKEMNVTFPDDLRALYLTHNGEIESGPGFFFGLPFLSLADMLSEWKAWKGLDEDEELNEIDAYSVPHLWIKESYANRHWIPISTDFGGNNIGIDFDPDTSGKVGQVINFGRDEEVKYVIAHQISDFLSFIAQTLQSGPHTIYDGEDYVSWCYGPEEELHFLDAIRELELPVLNPITSAKNDMDITQWFEQLDEDWRVIVQEVADSPQVFTQKKTMRIIADHITDLTPLTMCTDVRDLVLSGEKICDIAPLREMTALKKLYMVDTLARDIEPLAQLKNFQELKLSRTVVTDLQPLAVLPSLKTVVILDTPIVDYTPLSHFGKLETLEISITSCEQLDAIANIHTLQRLHLHHIENLTEKELHVFQKLTKLRKLTIENSTFSSLDFLKENKNLQELEFIDSSIKDGSIIAKLSHLHRLELNGTTIDNLEMIAPSNSLQSFFGAFEQFNRLKDVFQQEVDFSKIIGGMTDEEEEIWHDYLRSK